jgi:phospholipase C
MSVPTADQALGNDGRLGFRVPTLLISPRARRNHVTSAVYEHASILRTIGWRGNLEPLTVRDAIAYNLVAELDFEAPLNLAVPRFKVPNGPFASPCRNTDHHEKTAFLALRKLSVQHGFTQPD